jgi:hypothetical protein
MFGMSCGSDAAPSIEMKSTPFGGTIEPPSATLHGCCVNTSGLPDASTAPDMRA